MTRNNALEYMQYRMDARQFTDKDVDFIVRYIKHIHNKNIQPNDVILAVQSRMSLNVRMLLGDTVSSVLNSLYFHIVKKFNLSIREIQNYSKEAPKADVEIKKKKKNKKSKKK